MPANLQSAPPPQHDRHARYVHRARLRLPEESARFSTVFSLEEALRLTNLPGEDEGRLYFFRTLSLGALSAQATRRVWIEHVQASLRTAGTSAVHGSDASAAWSNAVYFNHLEEAFETLLRIALHDGSAPPPWFAASVLGPTSNFPTEQQQAGALVRVIVERLWPPAMPLASAASIVLAALEGSDPAPLLRALPAEVCRAWVGDAVPFTPELPLRSPGPALSKQLQGMVQKTAAQFGWRDPATLWLTTLAVAATIPSLAPPQVYVRARETLRYMEAASSTQRLSRAPLALDPVANQSGAEAVPADAEPILLRENVSWKSIRFEEDTLGQKTGSPHAGRQNPAISATDLEIDANAEPLSSADGITPEVTAAAATRQFLQGEPTSVAGLYFLLHVLRHLGIADALRQIPELAEADLPAHILHGLARSNGVPMDDPILVPLGIRIPFQLSPELLNDLPAAALPRNGGESRLHTVVQSGDLLRVWVRAVRLWCVRNARITVRGMIFRSGHVWLTRADLDVTLPLSAADVRIRRTGLDLDPLWLPWFGPAGRVVRFHYGNAAGSTGVSA